MAINKRVFGSPITGSVLTELKRRQSGTEEIEFGESVKLPQTVELSTRTPFVRMWVGVKLLEPEKIITHLKQEAVAEEISEPELTQEQKDLAEIFKNLEIRNKEIKKNMGYLTNEFQTATTYVSIPKEIKEQQEQAITTQQLKLKVNIANEKIEEIVREEITHESIIYEIGDYNYEKNYSEINPNESNNNSNNFFATENEKNPLLKPSAGITSVTSETEGTLGVLKTTTVKFVVHNFYDFDNIYNKYFLKPGAKVFVDYGWSNVKNLYKPQSLLDAANGDFLQDFLYGDTSQGDAINGQITKNSGNLEVLQGIVKDYSAKILQNGSVECSVTLLSANSALLSFTNDEKVHVRIKRLLESGIYYFGLQQILKNLPEDSQDRKDLSTDLVPNYTTSTEDIKIYEDNLRKHANRLFGLRDDAEKIQNVSVYTGLFLTGEGLTTDLSETYISWGKFEDFIINETFGHGKTTEDINKGNGTQIRLDSSNSFAMWSKRFKQRQRTMFKLGKNIPNFVFPQYWGDSPELNSTSYTFQQNKYPNDYPKDVNKAKYDKGSAAFGRIPLREVFINTKLILDAFESNKDQPIQKIIKSLLDELNEDSHNLFKWKLVAGDSETQLKVVDINYIQREKLKFFETDSGDKELFKFKIMSPNSMVKDYNLEFKLPQGRIGDQYAIKGMSVIDNINSDDPRVQNLVGAESIDFDNLKTLYLPDDGSLRIKQLQTKDADAEAYKVYEQMNDLLSTDTMAIGFNPNLKYDYIDAEEGSMYKDSTANETEKKDSTDVAVKQPQDYIKINNYALKMSGFTIAHSVNDYYTAVVIDDINKTQTDLLPYTLTLTIFGISSILPGDTFQVDYLPTAHLKNTFLQTMKVSHDLSPSGWYTTLDTQYRPIYPENKQSIFNALPAKVRLSPAVLKKEFDLVNDHQPRMQPSNSGWFKSKLTPGDMDPKIDWEEFSKYITDVSIETQPEDSRIDHIIHFTTSVNFELEYLKNNNITGVVTNHLSAVRAVFKDDVSGIGGQGDVSKFEADGFKMGLRQNNKNIVSQGLNTEQMTDDKVDLVYTKSGTNAHGRNDQNVHIWPANITMKSMTEYRLFIMLNSATIIDPKIDADGGVSEKYTKIKEFYQKFGGAMWGTYVGDKK